MIQIELFHPDHLPQLQDLVNTHLSVVVPGWSLPADYIARHLRRNPGQYVIDPWVLERMTLVALEKERVVAAAHLLHYGTHDAVGEYLKNAGDIAWLLAWPEHDNAATPLLRVCHEQMRAWAVPRILAWDSHLPVPLFVGIPEVWPHLARLFTSAGYRPIPEREEALYGGRLAAVPLPARAPVDGLRLRRVLRDDRGVAFVALVNHQEVGWCECDTNLSRGGELSALHGWAELTEMFVDANWRSRGIGSWLVQHAVEWLRLAGCDRIAFSVARDDEQNGAGHFYQRFGWHTFVRWQQGWSLSGTLLTDS
jgi:GNAT superfamily N-acetyltransferase